MALRGAHPVGCALAKGQSVRIAGRCINNRWSPVLCRPCSRPKSASMPVNAGAGLSGEPGAIGANRSNFHYGLVRRGRSELLANSGQTFGAVAHVQLCADFVAKVFLGWRTKILRAADAFYARRREGPYRFTQNRSWISVVALT